MEEKGNKKGKVILVGIIFLILGILIGYGVETYTNKSTNKNQSTNSEKNETKSNTEYISIFDENVEKAMDSFQKLGVSIDKKYTYDIKDITNKEAINTVIKSLEHEQINYCVGEESQLTKSLSMDDINNTLSQIVQDKKLTMEDLKENKEETSLALGEYKSSVPGDYKDMEYALRIKEDKVYIIGPCGSEGPSGFFLKTSLERAEKQGDALYVYQKVAYGSYTPECNDNDCNTYNTYYKDKALTEKVETDEGKTTGELTWKNYNTAKLTFKNVNGNYYFVKSEMI